MYKKDLESYEDARYNSLVASEYREGQRAYEAGKPCPTSYSEKVGWINAKYTYSMRWAEHHDKWNEDNKHLLERNE